MIAAALEAPLSEVAVAGVLEMLRDAGLEATDDPGALTPDPIGVLVGLPTLVGRSLGGATYTVPVTVVTGDPLNGPGARARLYGTADAAADAIRCSSYSPSSFSHGMNTEPLPSLELVATLSLSRQPASLERTSDHASD